MSNYQALSERVKISEIISNTDDETEAKKLFEYMKNKIINQHAITLDCENKMFSNPFVYSSFGFLLSEFKRETIREYIFIDCVDVETVKRIKKVLSKTEIHYKHKNRAEQKLKNMIESKKPDNSKYLKKHLKKMNKKK